MEDRGRIGRAGARTGARDDLDTLRAYRLPVQEDPQHVQRVIIHLTNYAEKHRNMLWLNCLQHLVVCEED